MAGEQEPGNGFKLEVSEKVGYFKRLSENFDTFMKDQKEDHESIRKQISAVSTQVVEVNKRLNKSNLKVAGLSGTVALVVTILALLIAAHLKG